MGGITPERIKRKVIAYWLSGLTRDEIAKKSGISEGNVSSIIQQAKENIPDIDLLREAAVGLKKQSFNLNTFASANRHRVFLQTRGLNDDQIDDMIQHIDEHCFKRGTDVKAFVERIHNVSLFSEKYACPIDELDELKDEKETKISQLDYQLENVMKEIQDLKSSRQAALAIAGLTEQDITSFRNNEPLIERIRELEERIHDLEEQYYSVNTRFRNLKVIMTCREMSGAALPIYSLPDGISFKEVVRACFLLAKNAPHFKSLIKRINEQEPRLDYQAGTILDVLESYHIDIINF